MAANYNFSIVNQTHIGMADVIRTIMMKGEQVDIRTNVSEFRKK